MAADTKQRMIEAAAGLLQRGGLEAASFTEVLASSGAARGAIYHHFPDGKQQLARDAVVWTGKRIRHNMSVLGGANPIEVVQAFLDSIRDVVYDASTGSSCAVAAIVIEAGQRDDDLTAASRTALLSWIAALEERFSSLGVDQQVGHDVATLLIIFLEGAQVLCRAVGNLQPFNEGRAAVEHSIATLLPASA